MHSPRPPSFPGVSRDAEEAAKGRDGYDFNGCSLRVELKRGAGPGGDRGGKRGQVPAFALGPLALGVTISLLSLCCSLLGLKRWLSSSVCKLYLFGVRPFLGGLVWGGVQVAASYKHYSAQLCSTLVCKCAS